MNKDKYPKPCIHPGHNPPGHMVIKPGQVYTHTCPGCGNKVVIHGVKYGHETKNM